MSPLYFARICVAVNKHCRLTKRRLASVQRPMSRVHPTAMRVKSVTFVLVLDDWPGGCSCTQVPNSAMASAIRSLPAATRERMQG